MTPVSNEVLLEWAEDELAQASPRLWPLYLLGAGWGGYRLVMGIWPSDGLLGLFLGLWAFFTFWNGVAGSVAAASRMRVVLTRLAAVEAERQRNPTPRV